MDFSYETIEGQVHIKQARDPGAIVVIPEEMEGWPVTELGAYALAGTDVEELHLPSQLKKIGAYAFYNCEKLRRIYGYGRAVDLGTGLFAGAGSVEFLDITLFGREKSCLKELLSELRQTLRVRIHQEEGEARLIFPEFFEESVENTPARILFIETHGCGHRYRYCFAQSQFQYAQYDELFPHVKVQEPEELVTELALGRLQYPLSLSADHKQMYQAYVAEHGKTAGQLLINANKPNRHHIGNLEAGGVPWLVKEILQPQLLSKQAPYCPDQEQLFSVLRELTRLAQETRDTETVSWLMNYSHELQARGRQPSVNRKRRFVL